MKLKFADVEISLDVAPERGLADTADLDLELTDLLTATGEAAQTHNRAIALFVDELQYIEEDQLASRITALDRCAQQQFPVTLIGAGLPRIVGQTGRAKSYAEKSFDFPVIGPLDDTAPRAALSLTAEKGHVTFDDDALDEILKQTRGYPYFLQEWDKHAC